MRITSSGIQWSCERHCHVEQIRKRTVEEHMESEIPVPDIEPTSPVVDAQPVNSPPKSPEAESELPSGDSENSFSSLQKLNPHHLRQFKLIRLVHVDMSIVMNLPGSELVHWTGTLYVVMVVIVFCSCVHPLI